MTIRTTMKDVLRPLRSAVHRQVDAAVRPIYAEELSAAVEQLEKRLHGELEELFRVLGDHLDATQEAETVFGRELSELAAGIEELRADIAQLRKGE